MSCPDGALLLAFSEGSLGKVEADAIVGHARDCPRCRAALDGEREVAHVIRNAARAAPAPGSHVSEHEIAALAEGALRGGDRTSVIAHVEACRVCRGSLADYLRDLRSLQPESVPEEILRLGIAVGARSDGAIGVGAEAPAAARLGPLAWLGRVLVPEGGHAVHWWRPAAIGGLLILAFAVLPRFASQPGRDGEGNPRTGPAGEADLVIHPSAETLSADDLAAGRVRFAWKAVPGAARYRAVLASDDGALLAETRTESTEWVPALSEVARPIPDRLLFWVEAISGGRTVRSDVRTYRAR